MENSPLISVIVPVYNVAEYLPECLDSIINQTYTNLEIILVDDGSTDECPKICDEYAEKDGRIRVIHKKNGGLSDARNAGLDICTGEWVGFVDSDDTIHKDMYKILYGNAVKHNAGISMCRNDFIVAGKYVSVKRSEDTNVIKGKSNIINNVFCITKSLSMSVCIKLFKNNRKIHFPVGKTSEDTIAFFNCIKEDDILVITDISLYYYRQREDSITHQSKYKRALIDTVDAYEYVFEQIKLNYPECVQVAERRLSWAYCIVMYFILNTSNCKSHYRKVTYFQKKLCKNLCRCLCNRKISVRGKIGILLAVISPKLYWRVYNKILRKRLKR